MSIFGFTKKFIARPKLLLGAAVVMTSMTASLPAFAANWLKCADGGNTCNTASSGNKFTVRYGANGVYYYSQFLNADTVSCSTYQGDPVQGTPKTCDVYPSHLTTASFDGAAHCANEGQLCSNTDDAMRWVYYGDPSSSGSKIAAIKYGSFMCNNASFGLDPANRIAKACYIGPRVYKAATGLPSTWTLCATSEGQSCNFSGSNSYSQIVVKYGVGTKWAMRLVTASPGASLKCNLTAFGVDPAPGELKSCSYLPLGATTATSSGVWSKITSCGGKNCILSSQLTSGTEVTNGSETGHSWGASVTGSVGASGLKIVNAGVAVTLSYTNSVAFQQSVTSTQMQAVSATCTGYEF